MSKPVEMRVTEPATPTEAPPSEGATPPEQVNITYASQQADASAPEGDYGWVIILSCFVISFLVVGTLYSWGIMQEALFKQGLSSPSTLSWIGSLAFTFIAVLATVNARIIQLLGARNTAFCGISLLALGEILSGSTTHKIGGLFITAGVLSGIGTSLCFLVVNVLPAQYFYRKRGIANGIVCAGGGLGGAVISLAMNAMIQHFGTAWTYRTLGLLTLVMGISAASFIKERCPSRSDRFIEWRLLRDFKFVNIFLVGFIATFSLLVPPFFIPLYSHSLGLSSSAGAGLVAGFNVSSALGRFFSGYTADALGPLNTLFIVLSLNTISMFLVWPLSNSVGPLAIFVIVNGASNGGFFATIPTVVGTLFGSQRVSIAMSMIVTGWGGGYLLGAPIAGYLLDIHNKSKNALAAYYPAMFCPGGMALIALVLVGVTRLRIDKHIKRKV